MPQPVGADAVIASPARFQRLRVARLRRRAAIDVQGRVTLAGLQVGEDCVIGAYAAVTPGSPPLRREPVRLGDGVHVGAHAAVEAGADIPARTVVGSYVVVAAEEVRSV